MIQNKLKLFKKTKLTHNVYELIFVFDWKIDAKSGQFITFLLPSWLRRAYSIAYVNWNRIIFLIKRVNEGEWWSREICDFEIWKILDFIWPIWNFILKTKTSRQLFIWTWTWIAPLYFQIIDSLNSWNLSHIKLIFWLRKTEDIFYEDILKVLKKQFSNFDYVIFLSREDTFIYRMWYVNTFLTKDIIKNFDEFYICWSTQMIIDVKWKLEFLGVSQEKLFFEQY